MPASDTVVFRPLVLLVEPVSLISAVDGTGVVATAASGQPARELSATTGQLGMVLVLPLQLTASTATMLSAISEMPSVLQAGTLATPVGERTQAR